MTSDGKKCKTSRCRNKAAKGRSICHKCKSRQLKERHPTTYYFNALRNNARRRGKSFKISLDYFRGFCDGSGYLNGNGKAANSLSIDRIQQHRGYEPGNIRILTLSQNSARGANEDVPF